MKVDISDYPETSDGNRTVEVSFIKSDFWNLDATLAMVIAPAIAQFIDRARDEEIVSGYPSSMESNEEWIEALEEMLWSFNEIANDRPGEDVGHAPAWREAYDAYHVRLQAGCELFGKHFQNLWE